VSILLGTNKHEHRVGHAATQHTPAALQHGKLGLPRLTREIASAASHRCRQYPARTRSEANLALSAAALSSWRRRSASANFAAIAAPAAAVAADTPPLPALAVVVAGRLSGNTMRIRCTKRHAFRMLQTHRQVTVHA